MNVIGYMFAFIATVCFGISCLWTIPLVTAAMILSYVAAFGCLFAAKEMEGK